MSSKKLMFFSVAAILAYDTMASLASMLLGFPYMDGTIGSLFIYAAAGFFAERVRSRRFSFFVGAVVGLADCTVGWVISWALGPGRTPDGILTIYQWLGSAAFAIVLASVCAGIAGVIGSFLHAPKRLPEREKK